ncbi:MAG TPA: ABC transporter permease [Longimicrobium sp.]|jgi:predicted permease
MRWIDGIRARLALLFGRRAAEERMDEEIGFHIEMETERLVREEGLEPVEARRRALVAFGGVEGHKEALRDGRGLAWLSGLSLDFKLGFRMLVKYPGLTIVGGLAMAFAIWAGSVTFVLVNQFLNPTLPLPHAERIVRIRNWDAAANEEEPRALSDFLAWRGGLRSVADLGAYREISINLIAGSEAGRPLRGAEISASAFRIAPEAPLLGRALVPGDERPGAAPVAVLGYEVWRTRFAGDAGIVGRTVRLGDTQATVVGVMPEGFAFPVAHELWTPFRPDAIVPAPREGPAIQVFGRLAPGVTIQQAQTELAAMGRRAAAERPDTHRHLQPRVARYTDPATASMDDMALMGSFNVFAVMLLVVICSNVALLLFARAAGRESELVVRSALGATRGRIVAQLVAEALVLGAVAAVVGLALAQLALRDWGVEFLERNLGALPFWFNLNLTPGTVLYACALTLLGAAIAGMVPARKITRGLGSRLKQGTGGGGGVRFGGVWTAVIVTQVALTVAFPAVTFTVQREAARVRSLDPGFASGEYLRVQLDSEVGADTAAQMARFAAAVGTLRQRLEAEPGVAGATFVDAVPLDHHNGRRIELDAPSGPSAAAGPPLANPVVRTAAVDPSYFDVLKAPVMAGRGFGAADLGPDAHVVIVDQGFVDRMLRGRSPVGRHLRFLKRGEQTPEPSAPWYEIVGVVRDLGMNSAYDDDRAAGVYLPAAPGRELPLNMIVHVPGDPMSLAPRIREIAAEVDPMLRLTELQPVDQVTSANLWILGMWFKITLLLTGVVLLLSLAGIYAVLSFTVARRTREIGVRVALGAPRARVVAAIFRKPLTQVGAGITVGFILVTAAAYIAVGHRPDGAPRDPDAALTMGNIALLVANALVMLAICMLACVVPTRRALRVQPSEALRAE